MGEDVGALQGLVEEAEDVVDDEDALLCVFGAGGIWGSIRYAMWVKGRGLNLQVFKPSTSM